METRARHEKVRKVLVSPNLQGKAGREHLSGILAYLDAGRLWDLRLARADGELTPDAVREALGDGTEGFVLSVASSARQQKTLDILAASRAKVVILDNHEPRHACRRFAYVVFDTDAIVAAGLDHFAKIAPGCAAAFVPASPREAWSDVREAAFRRIAAKRGLDFRIYGGAEDEPLARWLASLPSPCGILAANDMTALRVVETCGEAGLDVPERLSVLGIDNDEFVCGHARPPIASVEPNFAGAGHLAAAMLQTMMEGRRVPREAKVAESVNRIAVRPSAAPSRSSRTSPLVARAREAIRAEAAQLDLRSLAKRMGVSRTKLADAFAAAGSGVAAEIREARFEKVFGLLADPRQAIGPIANLCGWKSPTHLMRAFRARTGMTMGEWRGRRLRA